MDTETIVKKALAGRMEITSAVNGGEISILEDGENKTQTIKLFLTLLSKQSHSEGDKYKWV